MALQTLGSQIAQRYLSGWFFIDFISILPYDLLSLYADEEQTGVPLQLLLGGLPAGPGVCQQ